VIYIFPDYSALSEQAAAMIVRTGEHCIDENGWFNLVLSGGKTPEGVYRKLGERTRDNRKFWENTVLFWGDERCVPADDPDSNYHMVRQALLFNVPVPATNIHRIEAEQPDTEKMILLYEKKYPERADLVLLGMGSDGHTASLFPHSPVLHMTSRLFAPAQSPVAPIRRITMTPPAIHAAKNVLVLVSGKSKAELLLEIFRKNGNVHERPVRLVRDRTWYVDRDAAFFLIKTDMKNMRMVDMS